MLGIDVSKETLACTLFDTLTQNVRHADPKAVGFWWSRTYPNTTSGVARLLRQTPVASPWALEPTGRYSLLAATQAQAAGRSVLLAQPKKARHFLHSIQSRAKIASRVEPKPIRWIVMALACLLYAVR